MNTKHTAGTWQASKTLNDYAIYADSNDTKDIAAVYQYSRNIPQEEAEANAKLIAAAPELLQMVKDLKDCIQRLSQDDVSQLERDKEAQWEGEAHDLLSRINPNYYQNANE